MDKYKVLKQYFGYDSFRPGQEKMIDAVMEGRDAFGIMPTGGGKSLCYQIPALMLPGVTFIVSPLISLMQDQAMQLKEAGVSAAYINSTLTPLQLDSVYRNLRLGKYRIIYVAPERLETEEFGYAARELDISLFAVDEAHCISQWGQDFRPSYLRIPDFLASLPKRPILSAFTATATVKVREDIERLLCLDHPEKTVTSFDRPNLSFDVLRPKNRNKALEKLVLERSGKSGIIYCGTRKNVESVCERLCDAGIAATRYHAGLEDAERQKNQEDFLYDTKPVMVATNAFGMGINKSNVNYVIHYNMPKSLEEYYQEAGRAGRDGESAECILMYGASDIITAKFLIANGERLPDSELRKRYPRETERLDRMIDYCESTGCFRGKILDYFGEEHGEMCGNCGNCCGEYEKRDVTVTAQKILSCISRIHSKLGFDLGKAAVIDTLLGKESARTEKYGLSQIKTFGIMTDEKRADIEAVIEGMCRDGCLIVENVYGTLKLTERSKYVLLGDERVELSFRKKTEAELTEKEKRRIRKAEKLTYAENASVSEDTAQSGLYDVLRDLRSKLAAVERMPAYIVFSNATLADMAQKRPRDMKEFQSVKGVGESKAKKYGEAFLGAIAEYIGTNPQEETSNTVRNISENDPINDFGPDEREHLKRMAAMSLDKLWGTYGDKGDNASCEKANGKRNGNEDSFKLGNARASEKTLGELPHRDITGLRRNERLVQGKNGKAHAYSEKAAYAEKDSLANDESNCNDFGTVLYEAIRFLAEQPERDNEGVPPKVTSMLTRSGSVYNTVSFEKGARMSQDEKKILSLMTREYDTRVVKMATLWKDGSVYGTSLKLLERLYALDRANRNTQVLVAVNPRIKYDGTYEAENYNITYLKELIQE